MGVGGQGLLVVKGCSWSRAVRGQELFVVMGGIHFCI